MSALDKPSSRWVRTPLWRSLNGTIDFHCWANTWIFLKKDLILISALVHPSKLQKTNIGTVHKERPHKIAKNWPVRKMSVLAQLPLSVRTHYKFRKILLSFLHQKVRTSASEETPLSAKCSNWTTLPECERPLTLQHMFSDWRDNVSFRESIQITYRRGLGFNFKTS